jgi:hypothetical protein
MSGRNTNGLTRGGPNFNAAVAARVDERQAVNKYTGINSASGPAAEEELAECVRKAINSPYISDNVKDLARPLWSSLRPGVSTISMGGRKKSRRSRKHMKTRRHRR